MTWLRNATRNRLRGSLLGRALLQSRPDAPLRTIRIVSATRQGEKDFWRTSALGRSLKPWLLNPQLSVHVSFQNREGLPAIYNRHIDDGAADVLVFVHDDVWLDDSAWMSKLLTSFARFDVVGLAGNTRRQPHQPAWLFTSVNGKEAMLDSPHLSGTVGHGPRGRGQPSVYGPSPARCRLLDGVFIAVRTDVVRRSGVRFDPRFAFHFYDLDFCRSAERAGLSLGTWPISVTHQSIGAFGGPAWEMARGDYFLKWKS